VLPVPDGTASQVQSALDKTHAVNLADIDFAGGRMGSEARGSRKLSPCYDISCDGGGAEGLWSGRRRHTRTAKRRALMGVRWGMLLLGWGSSVPVTSSRLGQACSCYQRSASPWTCSRWRKARAGPMRDNSSVALQSKTPPRGCSRSSMTEPMSNVCTPKGMWCLECGGGPRG
jgi:hypothetical protein